jgi:hypothetical protein
VEGIVNLDREGTSGVERIVPKGNAIGTNLIGIDQGMIKAFTVVE